MIFYIIAIFTNLIGNWRKGPCQCNNYEEQIMNAWVNNAQVNQEIVIHQGNMMIIDINAILRDEANCSICGNRHQFGFTKYSGKYGFIGHQKHFFTEYTKFATCQVKESMELMRIQLYRVENIGNVIKLDPMYLYQYLIYFECNTDIIFKRENIFLLNGIETGVFISYSSDNIYVVNVCGEVIKFNTIPFYSFSNGIEIYKTNNFEVAIYDGNTTKYRNICSKQIKPSSST